MEGLKLGRISKASFGLGGYQDAMLGLHLTFDFKGSGVCTEDSAWDSEKIECSVDAKWTEEERSEQYDKIMRNLSTTLHKAKVDSVEKLVGIPVEVALERNTLKSWRVLEEVL